MNWTTIRIWLKIVIYILACSVKTVETIGGVVVSSKERAYGMWALLALFLVYFIGIIFVYQVDPGLELSVEEINKIEDYEAKKIIISEATKIPVVKAGVILLITLVIGVLVFVITNYVVQSESVVEKMIVKGRTVEYITIILIVGIVLILALLGILREETIGTILGTIAGYVLGRAVSPREERPSTPS